MDGAAGNHNGATPPRVLISGGGTPGAEEAAAVAAAIERFVKETAPSPAAEPEMSGWQRAALIEGVTARQSAFPPDPKAGFPAGM